MKPICILAIPFILLISCTKNEGMFKKDISNPKSSKVEFVQIAKSNIYGYSDQMPQVNLVITSSDRWKKLINQMNNVKNGTSESFTETSVDFNKYIVLAVFDSVYRNGGHSIDISDVVESNYNIVATIEYQNPYGDLTSIMTQPFEIIKITKTTKQVTFN